MKQPKLSICIATHCRGLFIGETLNSILSQVTSEVEIIIVDGASPDCTPEVVSEYLSNYSQIRYYRESENSGVDRDYDKAVSYASGEYCWLMTDDDLMRPGAIDRVLSELRVANDLIIANAEVRDANLANLLSPSRLALTNDRTYLCSESEIFFSECLRYLSFIGSIIIKRELWIDRDRSRYYGSLFIHVGVICQKPLSNAIRVISEPLITIRFGNAMWTPRGFEIWMFMWPQLIWSFQGYSDNAKRSVYPKNPSDNPARLFYFRALGAYGLPEFRKFMRKKPRVIKLFAYVISRFPARLANYMCILSLIIFKRSSLMAIYDLSQSSTSTAAGRLLARIAQNKIASA